MNVKAFASLSVAIFVAMLGMGIVSPLMALYATDMGASGFWLGVMYSGFSLCRALIQPFAGWFSDKKGRKSLIVVGLSAYTVVSIGYALARNIPQLALVRLFHGAASAMVIPVAQAYVGDICPKGREGQMMGTFFMTMYLGMAAGPILGGTVSRAFSINMAFYVMAGLAAFGLLLLVLFVPRIEAQEKRNRGKAAPMSVMLKDNKVKAVAIYLGSRGILRQGISAFLPLFAVKVLGLDVAVASVVVSIYILTEAFGQGLVGPIADRFPRKRLMIIAAVITPIMAFFIKGMTNVTSLLSILIPVALMTTVGRIPALAYNVEVGAKYGRMGVGMGVTNAAQDLGHFLGPIAFGWAMDQFGIGSVFTVGAIICMASALPMSYWLLRQQPEPAWNIALEVAADPKK